jgi:hypothetical protein
MHHLGGSARVEAQVAVRVGDPGGAGVRVQPVEDGAQATRADGEHGGHRAVEDGQVCPGVEEHGEAGAVQAGSGQRRQRPLHPLTLPITLRPAAHAAADPLGHPHSMSNGDPGASPRRSAANG